MGTLSLNMTTPRLDAIRQASNVPLHSAAEADKLTMKWLAKEYPHLFKTPKPLELGIHKALLKAKPESVSSKSLRRVLSRWCRKKPYRAALAKGGERYGLAKTDGIVTPEQQAQAAG